MLRNHLLNSGPISDQIQQSFDHLPEDRYLSESFNYRMRRYHSGYITNEALRWDKEPKIFNQAKAINQLAGGVQRQFPSIPVLTRKFISNQIIMGKLYNKLPQGDYDIGVHQIRIIANDTYMGKPAPEGIHQDGFDYLCVFCVNLDNATGGDSLLVDLKDHANLLVDLALKPGEMLLFNDRLFAHYASPIMPKLPGEARRDVFVMTFKKRNQEESCG